MPLRPSQIDASNAVLDQSTLLLADVGAGKTAVALTALGKRNLILGRKRTLVLGTKRICDTVWGAERDKWLPEYSYVSVAGLPAAGRFVIMMDPNIDIIGLNFENLAWAAKTFGDDLAKVFPNLIIDESSKLENPVSKSFRALRPLLPLFQWRLPMTGTPCANHLHDIWGSAYLADLGQALGDYKQAFLQCFFHPVQRRIGLDWIPAANAAEEIKTRLQGTVYRMPFVWHDPVEIDVVLPLNRVVKSIQGRIDKELKKEVPTVPWSVIIDGVTYARDGNRINAKMLQLPSGFIYDDNHAVQSIHLDKITALREIVEEAHGEPVMVVFQFDHERDAILNHFPQARLLDSNDTLEAWNDGQIEVLLVHPRSCGHGLNAQLSGCDLQVWFSPTTDAELYGQTIGRLNRPGNDKTIRVMRLIMEGTKDRAAYSVVAARQKGENATLESFE